ncbi:MAG TPA: tetratricopeptide repeat protein [Firmicutes bacterium]|jgi:tetratricopeptide (TPR) repeat protein|nr:tetratricopeptide repeat protein [Bacillota bacterium]
MARKDRVTLAKRIKERRLQLGLTQREVAGDDFTRGFISQVENGIIDPSLKSLEIIAKRLGTTTAAFLQDASPADSGDILSELRKLAELRDNGDHEAALELALRINETAADQPDTHLVATVRYALGWSYYQTNRYEEAARVLEEASATFRHAGDLLAASKALNTAATACYFVPQMDEAIRLYKAALRIQDDLFGNMEDKLRINVNLALAYVANHDYDRALPLLQKVLDLENRYSDFYRIGDIYMALGIVYRHLGRYEHSADSYKKAIGIFQNIGDPLRVAHSTLNLGITYTELKDFAMAKQAFNEAKATYADKQLKENVANANAELAWVAWLEEDVETADKLSALALDDLGPCKEKGRMLILRGRILDKQGHPEDALASYMAGYKLLDSLGKSALVDATDSCFEIGNLLLRLNRADEASQFLIRAATAYREMSNN